MNVSLKYGKRSLKLEIPRNRLLQILKPRSSIRHGQTVPEALMAPIGAEPLPKLLDHKARVVVVVSDVTRPCPTRRILPHVLRQLKKSGVRRDKVQILIATGTHRGQSAAERRRILGEYATSISQVIDHTMHSVQYVGETKRGTKVSVNPVLLNADFSLAIGNVDVHYFAGYTGGYKAVIPGVAGTETIAGNHALFTLPNAEPGVADSNPVREDFEEAGKLAGLQYVVNVVLDEANRIIASFAGDPVVAHRSAAKTNDDFVKIPIKEPADIVIASAGGYPRDMNLYQAHKAIENASHAVKNGGTIVLFAECTEGFGNRAFEKWTQDTTDLDEIGHKLSKKFILGPHKAFALSKIAKRASIILATDSIQANNVIMRTLRPQDALNHALGSHGEDASLILVPCAMNILPVVSS